MPSALYKFKLEHENGVTTKCLEKSLLYYTLLKQQMATKLKLLGKIIFPVFVNAF